MRRPRISHRGTDGRGAGVGDIGVGLSRLDAEIGLVIRGDAEDTGPAHHCLKGASCAVEDARSARWFLRCSGKVVEAWGAL